MDFYYGLCWYSYIYQANFLTFIVNSALKHSPLAMYIIAVTDICRLLDTFNQNVVSLEYTFSTWESDEISYLLVFACCDSLLLADTVMQWLNKTVFIVRFEVFTAGRMMMMMFWLLLLCRVVRRSQHFREHTFFIFRAATSALEMMTVCFPKTYLPMILHGAKTWKSICCYYCYLIKSNEMIGDFSLIWMILQQINASHSPSSTDLHENCSGIRYNGLKYLYQL